MHGHVGAAPPAVAAGGCPIPNATCSAYLYCGVTTVLDPADLATQAFARRERVGERASCSVRASSRRARCSRHRAVTRSRCSIGCCRGGSAGTSSRVSPGRSVRPRRRVPPSTRWPSTAPTPSSSWSTASRATRRACAARLAPRSTSPRPRRARGRHIGSLEDAIDAAERGVAAWMHGVYKERIPDEQDRASCAGYHIPMVATIEVFESYARLWPGSARGDAARARDGPRGGARRASTRCRTRTSADCFRRVPRARSAAARHARRDNVRRLHAAGVTILAGSDTQAGVFPGAGLHRELRLLTEAGLSPAEAIRAATLDARALPRQRRRAGLRRGGGRQARRPAARRGSPDGQPRRPVAHPRVIKDGVPLERRPVDAS